MRRVFSVGVVLMLAALWPRCVRSAPAGGKQWERWVHLHVAHYSMAKHVIAKSAALGYDKIVILWTGHADMDTAGEGRFSKKKVQELIDYAKYTAKIDPIPSIKLLGKTKKTLGKKWVSEHPELVVRGNLDPFAKLPNGKTVMDGIILPLIDEYIEIYHNPSHFQLGWDEYHTDGMKEIADRHGLTVSDVWAGTLNRVAEHLLSKNVTPMVFGDQFLSPLLGGKDNPVGYPGDKRFHTFPKGHSRHPRGAETDLLPFVKDIRNRDKIVMVPWHYNMGSHEGAYPSIDFFQWLGFKEIHAASWFCDREISSLARYASKKGCTGMWATLWHTHFSPVVRPILNPILENSIVYFDNPSMSVPADIHPRVLIAGNGRPVAAVKPGDTIQLGLESPGKDLAINLRRRAADDPKSYVTWLNMPFEARDKWLRPANGRRYVEWTADAPGLYDVIGETHKAPGLLHQGYMENALLVTDTRIPAARPSRCLLGADLTRDIVSCDGAELVVLRGRGNANFGFLRGDARRTAEGVACRAGGVKVYRTAFDRHSIVPERVVMVEFKPAAEQPDGLKVVFAWGNYNAGWRILLNPDNTLLAQMTYGSRPVGLTSKMRLKPDTWHRVVFGADKDRIRLLLDGKEEAATRVPGVWAEPHWYPIGLGAEFSNKRDSSAMHLNGVFRRFGVWARFEREPRL